MDFVGKTKGFLLDPAKTFEASKEDSLKDAIKYYLITVVIFSTLVAFPFSKADYYKNIDLILIFVRSWILAFIVAFILGIFVHFFAYLTGGRKGNAQTIKAVMYATTPAMLFGWIPSLYIIAVWIWSLILAILGIHKLHGITMFRSSLPVLALIITIVALFLDFVSNLPNTF